ncbi:MAG TPA: LPS assembly protein LptD [Silvibacterium sp.]|nr:LPS assembly protein LptD [Silvibacterium sp.]
MLLLLCHPQLWSQAVTKQFPPAADGANAAGQNAIPVARVIPPPVTGFPVKIEADTQSYEKTESTSLYTLTGHVVIHYRDYIIQADRATFDQATSEGEAEGHVHVDGGPDDAHFLASHGTMNLNAHTGTWYDVAGTLEGARLQRSRKILSSSNPFAVTARELTQSGPASYQVIDGTVTSCALPNPDWRLVAKKFFLSNGIARARSSIFELDGLPVLHKIPVFYLPYATHPVNEQRESGFLIPVFGDDTSKGLILGEEVYFVLGRSADLLLGAEYFSNRGFAPLGQFRYRGRALDFATVKFHSLLDRLPAARNQGGADFRVDGRHDFSPETRAVAGIEYLSSYAYRQAFEESYALAINSEVNSQLFLSHTRHGLASGISFNRYQSFVSNATSAAGQEEITIWHVPTAQFDGIDQSLLGTPLMWGVTASGAGLSRSEPGFQTTTFTPRVDLYPHLALPLHFDGWTLRPVIAVRDTFYGRSQNPAPLGNLPSERDASLNRKDFEASADLRPPTLERDFTAPWLERLLGGDVRHAVEPEIRYRWVAGIDKFNSVLRFDSTDVASDTNEVEYSLTNRVFVRHLKLHPCTGDDALRPDKMCGGQTVDWLSWQVAQKYFFEPDFGGAVTSGTRNVLDTTLDLSGVAFLTSPRHYSPVISRMRWRTSSNSDMEWDVDYDTKTGRLDASNVFAGYHLGNYTVTVGDAHLHTVSTPAQNLPQAPAGQSTSHALTDFNQLRFSTIYGSPAKLGLSAGASGGYDFTLNGWQYYGVQSSYNWNCCGLSFELRHYSLGSVRDDTEKLYSFTLAGVGAAGSLKRAERVITGLSPF